MQARAPRGSYNDNYTLTSKFSFSILIWKKKWFLIITWWEVFLLWVITQITPHLMWGKDGMSWRNGIIMQAEIYADWNICWLKVRPPFPARSYKRLSKTNRKLLVQWYKHIENHVTTILCHHIITMLFANHSNSNFFSLLKVTKMYMSFVPLFFGSV